MADEWPLVRSPDIELTREGKASLAIFALALIWWVFEVVPIGVTAIAIGTAQALLLIRPAKAAFETVPSVKTGLEGDAGKKLKFDILTANKSMLLLRSSAKEIFDLRPVEQAD